MTNPILPRLGAACGTVFPIVLFVSAGNGNQAFSAPRAVAGVAAITLAVPFIAYLSGLLRAAEGASGWLATTAVGAGVMGIALKLVSVFPELALHRARIADGTQLHRALQQMGDGATVLSLYPLAIFCAATAIVVLRTRVLPRWLGGGAGIAAVALAVNGGFLESSMVPGLLVFLVWTLLTSVHLLRRAWREPAPVRDAGARAAAV